MTLTAPILNEGRLIAFLVQGAGKAQVLKDVIEGPYQPTNLPAQLIKPTSGELRWLVDQGRLEHSPAGASSGELAEPLELEVMLAPLND